MLLAGQCERSPPPLQNSKTCSPKEEAAGQQPSESSPETSDHSYQAQRHLRAKMMAVRVGRQVQYLEATRDEQP
jgi:hypothetical protein